MGIGAAISACTCYYTYCVSLFVPLLDTDFEVIKSGFTFNYGEFAIIKIRVEHRLPSTKVFEGVSIS